MPHSRIYRLVTVALLSCAIAGCQSKSVTLNGSGYQFVKFKSTQAAILAAQDELAGPAINSNNRQCEKDKACSK